MRVADLCCGKGGWTRGFLAEGWDVHGYDIIAQPDYPARISVVDVRKLIGSHLGRLDLIVASPPCDDFTRHQMPWTRRRNPPPPDLSIWQACRRLAVECGVPIIIENVRAAQGWMGRAKWHYGQFYLWGDVPALMPQPGAIRKKESLSSTAKLERALVPFELARYIASTYKERAA